MSSYLTKAEFQALRLRLEAGNARLKVPKYVARRFFHRVSNKDVVSVAKASVLPKKLCIFLLHGASLSLFIVGLGLVFIEFESRAAAAIPALGVFWAILTILTSDKGNHWIGHAGLLLSLATLLLLPFSYSYPIALTGTSIWISRCIYSLSQFWLEQLLMDSYDAFEMMVEHIEIEETEIEETEIEETEIEDTRQSNPQQQLP